MEYGRLIGETWRIVWQYRWLWFFGIFAASPGASCTWLFSVPSAGRSATEPEFSREFEQPMVAVDPGWFQANAGLLVVAGCVAIVFVLALWALSLISQGALVTAVARFDRGERPSFAEAWRAGVSTFWRFLGLNVVAPAAALLVALVFTPAGLLFVAGLGRIGDLGGLFVVLGLLVGLAALLIAVPLWIAIWIATIFAMRAVAVEGCGFGAGLRQGVDLLRRQLGTCLTLWLVNLGLSFAGSLAVLMLLAIPALPLVAIALVVLLSAGPAPISVAVVGLLALMLVVVVAVCNGALNAYLWSYWTLGYLRLTQPASEEAT